MVLFSIREYCPSVLQIYVPGVNTGKNISAILADVRICQTGIFPLRTKTGIIHGKMEDDTVLPYQEKRKYS